MTEKELRPELLTHPNIPKPLHGLNPRSLLGQEWWDRHRREAAAKYDYCCWACGIRGRDARYHQWLEGHEVYLYDYENGAATLSEIASLCHSCHNFIHSGRLGMLLRKKEITEEKFTDIINHGQVILRENNLTPMKAPIKTAPWNEWKLIVDGKEYRGRFKNYEEWENYYSGGVLEL
jgi:hypothetical protein